MIRFAQIPEQMYLDSRPFQAVSERGPNFDPLIHPLLEEAAHGLLKATMMNCVVFYRESVPMQVNTMTAVFMGSSNNAN